MSNSLLLLRKGLASRQTEVSARRQFIQLWHPWIVALMTSKSGCLETDIDKVEIVALPLFESVTNKHLCV